MLLFQFLKRKNSTEVKETFKKNFEKYMAACFNKKQEEIYYNTSSREISKNNEKIFEYIDKEKDLHDLLKHKEIVEALKKINKSDFLAITGMHDTNIRDVKNIQMCQQNNKETRIMHSLNSIISPKGKIIDHFLSPNNEFETKANRYNVKNKRITLNASVVKNEVEDQLKNISDQNRKENKLKIIKNMENNKRNEQKTFYNKWFLPVKFWKIEKKPKEKKVFTGFFFKKRKIYFLRC